MAKPKKRPLRYRGLSDAQIDRLGPVAVFLRRLIRLVTFGVLGDHHHRL
jgi:hypothetical protein